MAEFKIDRLRYTWVGPWTTGNTYAKDVVVSTGGKSYTCLTPHTAGQFGTDLGNGLWQLMTTGTTFIGQWQSGIAYVTGNIILYAGSAYICSIAHTSAAPFNTFYWTVYGDFDKLAEPLTWAPNTVYGSGSTVKYGGWIYNCSSQHTSSATYALGLEADISNWVVMDSGIEYLGTWTASTRYIANDLVKYGPDLWINSVGHTTGTTFNSDGYWSIWLPGIDYAGTWSSTTTYQPGDMVVYGGYDYISKTQNNINHTPSLDSANWDVFTQGYSIKTEWNNATTYLIGSVVKRHGMLYVSTADNTNQDPTALSLIKTYTASGSSGTTLKVGNTTGILPGMILTGGGFSRGQSVVQIVDGVTLIINEAPDNIYSTITDSENITLRTINYTYWNVLVPGINWTNKWHTGITYTVGDIAGWKNQSYRCIQGHTATPLTSPDTDTARAYWVYFLFNDPRNALNEFGDMLSYQNGNTVAIPIGSTGSILKTVGAYPTWSTLNITPNVYYVATNGDDTNSGLSWDTPFKTVAHACSIVQSGALNPQASFLMAANKEFVVQEAYYWMLYQISQNNPPFSTNQTIPDATKTQRDLRYVLDSFIYDVSRGGTSQTVASTLLYFDIEYQDKFTTTEVANEMPYFIAVLNEAYTLLNYAITNTTPPQNFQTLVGLAAASRVTQSINLSYTAEAGVDTKLASLENILTSALTAGTSRNVPPANAGATSTIFIKSGTFAELTPITIPENTALVGDELRGTVIKPAIVINTLATSSIAGGINKFTVGTTTNMYDGCPVQFVSQNTVGSIIDTTFGGITAGKTYYVIGNSISAKQFQVTSIYGQQTNIGTIIVSSLNGSGATFNVIRTNTTFQLTPVSAGNGYAVGDRIKIAGPAIGGLSPANDIAITITGTTKTFSILTPNSATGSGQNATFTVTTTNATYSNVTIVNHGVGYNIGDIITISGTQLGGARAASVIGFINGTILTPTLQPSQGPFIAGDLLIAVGITPGTTIVSVNNTSFTGYIDDGTGTQGDQLTILNMTSGTITLGMLISGSSTISPTYITAFGTGTGGAGTYTVSNVQIVGSNQNQIIFTGISFTLSNSQILGDVNNPTSITTNANDLIITVATIDPIDQSITGITFTGVTNGYGAITSTTNSGSPIVALTTNRGYMYVYGGGALMDMFRVRNGTGIRNMTLSGLLGTLSSPNAYGSRRPTGGTYVALDPGDGPNDTSAWIFRKSPYIQNVTVFGLGSIGMKIDSTLHNGGNTSMVCNDYTNIMSDGIGIWLYGGHSLCEAVSVFTYYCYAGYFSENGGRMRATNGNSSYGDYGVIAEGYDVSETPISGSVDNRSGQAIAAAVSSFGASAQILKVQFSNAGNAYTTTTTNLLKYTNNFINTAWQSDGNVTFFQNTLSPQGYTEAWTLTSLTTLTDSAYLYQDVPITRTGASYTGLSGTNVTGSGSGATFDVVVTPTGFVVTVNAGGSGYVFGNVIRISGTNIGGTSPANDITLNVVSIQSPSSILTVASVGSVPLGVIQYYTNTLYVLAGTAISIDLYTIFSGYSPSPIASAATFNFTTKTLTTSSQDNGGMLPLLFSATPVTGGWYRLKYTVYDNTGLNTSMRFKIYPRGRFGTSGSVSIYGAQIETGINATYYCENQAISYSPYASFRVTGSGTGVVSVGDEIRSNAGFEHIIVSGGAGYLTSSNNAQGGTGQYLILAQSDVGTSLQYYGMRLFITSGAGAGQYGYIAYFNTLNKNAYVLKESFTPLLISAADGANNYSLSSGADVNTLYTNQPVQFLPNPYTIVVKQVSQANITILQTIGGIFNTITVSDTRPLYQNMPVTITLPSGGATFGGLITNYTYYVSNIIDQTTVQLASSYGGQLELLINGPTPTTTVTVVSSATTVITLSIPATLAQGQLISFNNDFGNVTAGTIYYVYANTSASTSISITTDYLGATAFTVGTYSGSTIPGKLYPNNVMYLNYPDSTGYLKADSGSTVTMAPNYSIQFQGTAIGQGITVGIVYVVNDVIDSATFTLSTATVTVSPTATSATITLGGIPYTNVITVSDSTSVLKSMYPIIFTGTAFGGLTALTKYYVNTIIDATHFTVSTSASVITTYAFATALTSNLITVTSTAGFYANAPIVFVGASFGNIVAEQTYYISVINDGTTFTISTSPGGASVNLVRASGKVIVRTVSAVVSLTTTTGTLVGTSSGAKVIPAVGGIGTMIGTYSTPVFGNVQAGTTYYIKTITPGTPNKIQISTASGGTVFGLAANTGAMLMAEIGWDNINPGTPNTALFDSTSVYYLEPRTVYNSPRFDYLAATYPLSFTNITYGQQQWKAFSKANPGSVYTTQDGNTWVSGSLPVTVPLTKLVFGNNYWVGISYGGTGGSTVLYSNSAGATWKTSTLPSVKNWALLEYGQQTFVAISNGNSYNAVAATNVSSATGGGSPTFTIGISGVNYNAFIASPGTGYAIGDTLKILGTSLGGSTPTNDASILVTAVAGGFIQSVQITGTAGGTGGSVTAYSLDNGYSWTLGTGLTNTLNWSGVAYGAGRWVAVASGSRTVAYSLDGKTWTQTSNALPSTASWSSIVFGKNLFVTASSTSATPCWSFDGITWYSSPYSIQCTNLSYGQGAWVALNGGGSTTYYTSEDAKLWTFRTGPTDQYTDIAFGYKTSDSTGLWISVANALTGRTFTGGCTTQSRPTIASGEINKVNLWEPGSGYSTQPVVTYVDPNNSSDASVTVRYGSGVLASPTFISRGQNFSTSSTQIKITGNGYADTAQTGTSLYVKTLSSLPSPGDNLTITGVGYTNSQIYKVTSAIALYGTTAPLITALLGVSPSFTSTNSPANGASVSIREKYSQVRLTNHDFLYIGYGNQIQSGYPGFPEPDSVGDPATVLTVNNQTLEVNQGRVFYTSTDQDGNFVVGNLFGVQQATGIVTLNASQFGLTGLSQLKLGGISVGSNAVIITAFSTDSTFLANSNQIIPTQKAIRSYISGRLTQGGSNTFTGQLIAGTVSVGGPNFITSTVPAGTNGSNVKMLNKVNIAGQLASVDGTMMAETIFIKAANVKSGIF
jgi:hypothetical protein